MDDDSFKRTFDPARTGSDENGLVRLGIPGQCGGPHTSVLNGITDFFNELFHLPFIVQGVRKARNCHPHLAQWVAGSCSGVRHPVVDNSSCEL